MAWGGAEILTNKMNLVANKTEILSFLQQKNNCWICNCKTDETVATRASFDQIFRSDLSFALHLLCNTIG